MCKVGAARNVFGAVNSHGMGSAKVLDVFDKHINWFSQHDPPVSSPCPICVRQSVFKTQASAAWPEDIFWASIRTTEMVKQLDVAEDKTEQAQVNMFTSKMLDFVAGMENNVISNLTSLRSSPASCGSFFSSCPKLSAEVELLKVAMQASRKDVLLGQGCCTEDRLTRFLNEASEVYPALDRLSFGRGIILQVRTALEQGQAKDASISHWQSQVAALCTFAGC